MPIVSVWLGTGTGTFGTATTFSAGNTPYMLAMGDFNGDGKLDLATTNNGSANVSVLLGNGNGTFGAATNFAVGSAPRGIATGDFNGDGKLDLVVSNVNSNTVSVLLGTGTGSFASAVNYAVGSGPVALAVSDFNGDGKADIAVTNGGGGTITLLFGNGNGTFAGRADFTIGDTPRGIAVNDYNGDGKADILVANLNSNSLSILLHNPTAPGPAGIAGHAIGLGLSNPWEDSGSLTNVTVSGVPTGWTLNAGTDLGDGRWDVSPADLGQLAVTAPNSFAGAKVLDVTETWIEADGTTASLTFHDNVEVYQPGSPIFAWSAQDWLSGSGAHDRFVFDHPIGNDTIYNFDAATDQIDLIGFDGVSSFEDVAAHLASDPAGNAVINFGDGETITLTGVNKDALTAADFVFNETPVVHNAGTMLVGDGATLPLGGIMTNTGTIEFDGAGELTGLQIGGGGLTLQGGGHVQLSDSSSNYIGTAADSATLVNLDNTISGAGTIGNASLTLENHGLIVATGGNPLLIDTGSHAILNTGTLEAQGGSLDVRSDVTGGGDAVIDGGSIEFGGASDTDVTFTDASSGILKLDYAADFTGKILSIGDGDKIDLADLAPDVSASIAGSSDGATTTLSVQSGGASANLAIANGNSAAVFSVNGDGDHGTMISVAGAVTDGSGNSVLQGTAGNDFFFGGSGSDTFVFRSGGGHDVIGNFDSGHDAIELHGLLQSFADVQAHASLTATGTLIDLGGGDTIQLDHVAPNQLAAQDFHFLLV